VARFRLQQNKFFGRADELRAVFDERFADTRSTRGDRFVWDYWHMPGQYTHLRTPAWEYFPEELYEDFHRAVVDWGRRSLGCWDISPPWLSCYVDGCRQELHADVPHGPWAFVFSLAPVGPRRFQGGETMILRPEALDYWPHFNDQVTRERESFVDHIPTRFNRLLCFDPRLPHGVTRVSGTQDPRHGRLVIHGWFTEPRPFIEGALSEDEVSPVLDEGLAELVAELQEFAPLHGTISLRLEVNATGQVQRLRALANTLVKLDAPGTDEAAISQGIRRHIKRLRFPKAQGPTDITLPLLFR